MVVTHFEWPARCKQVLAFSVLALLLLALSSCQQAAPSAPPAQPPMPVTVSHPLTKDIIDFDEFTARLSAVDSVEIRARVSGYLQKVNFKDGAEVKKGDLLFVIDPRPFQTPLVEVVPTLILTDGAGKELARVSGISRPDWILEQVGQGRRGDLGVRGPTVAVSEPDLIAELQRRLVAIDWSARREAALARYWARAAFAELPVAEKPRERRLDLTLVAQADVTLSDGTTVIRAGERVDPLAVMPFRQRLFVFDATDPRQVAEVARRGAASRADGRLPLYLATRLDREAGWGGYRDVQTALHDPLYLLTSDVQRRFQIERVPAVVESRDGVLVVSEWVPER